MLFAADLHLDANKVRSRLDQQIDSRELLLGTNFGKLHLLANDL